MKYRTEKNGNLITLWNDAEGIGLQFNEGDTLQEYKTGVVIKDTALLSTEEGVRHLTEVQAELTAYAKKHYPKEFGTLTN